MLGVQYFQSKPTIEQLTLLYSVTLPLPLMNFKYFLIYLNNNFGDLKSENVGRTDVTEIWFVVN
jgi:hypothetical protein